MAINRVETNEPACAYEVADLQIGLAVTGEIVIVFRNELGSEINFALSEELANDLKEALSMALQDQSAKRIVH